MDKPYETTEEVKRLLKVYEDYKSQGCYESVWHPLNLTEAFYRIEREKKLVRMLNSRGIKLEGKKILDVGCGRGNLLRLFISLGADPDNLYGLDLLDEEIEIARHLTPSAHLLVGNAEKMPYPDREFDIVMQHVMFSSIYEPSMRRNVANEILRVLKNDGIFIWWDLIRVSPGATARAISRNSVRELFPGCKIWGSGVGISPGIVARLMKISWPLCELVSAIWPFKAFDLLFIEKAGQ